MGPQKLRGVLHVDAAYIVSYPGVCSTQLDGLNVSLKP